MQYLNRHSSRSFLITTGFIMGLLCLWIGTIHAQTAAPPTLKPGKLIMSINATIPLVQFIDEKGNLQGMRRAPRHGYPHLSYLCGHL